jgi:hypothetical protein
MRCIIQPNTPHYFGSCHGSVSQTPYYFEPCHGSVNQTHRTTAVPWLSHPNTPYYFEPCHGSVIQTHRITAVPWLSQPNTLRYLGPCHGSVSQTHCITLSRATAVIQTHRITLNRAMAQSAKHTALLRAVPWLSQSDILHYFEPCYGSVSQTPYYFEPCHGSVSQTHCITSGRAMAQVLSCDVLTWRPVKSPGTECRICGGQGDTRPEHVGFPVSTIAPCSTTTPSRHWRSVTWSLN